MQTDKAMVYNHLCKEKKEEGKRFIQGEMSCQFSTLIHVIIFSLKFLTPLIEILIELQLGCPFLGRFC